MFVSFQDSNSSLPHPELHSHPKTAETQLLEMFPGETKENIECALQGNNLTEAIDILLNQESKGQSMYMYIKIVMI